MRERERERSFKLAMEFRKSHSSNKIHQGSQSVCTGSTRKLSTKEKCRRQKDAERVEKLRLLVSYLRSGSSKPVVSPVALEADEIELAQRYKSQLASRDDLLSLAAESEPFGGLARFSSPPSAPVVSELRRGPLELSPIVAGGQTMMGHPSARLVGAASTSANNNLRGNINSNSINNNNNNSIGNNSNNATSSTDASHAVASNTSLSTSSCSMSQAHRRSVGLADYLGASEASNCGAIKNSDSKSAVVASMSATRSIPHIGQMSWVLRHSISDPGYKFGHTSYALSQTTATSANQCSSTSGARSSIASGSSANNNQLHTSIGQLTPNMASLSVSGQMGYHMPTTKQHALQSTNSSSFSTRATDAGFYNGSNNSGTNYSSSNTNSNNNNNNNSMNSNNNNNNNDINYSSSFSSIIQQNQQPLAQQHQEQANNSKHSPRLFYIDDIDAPSVTLQPSSGPHESPNNPHQLLMSTPNSNLNDSMATMMTQAVSSGNFTSSICSSTSQQQLLPTSTTTSTTTPQATSKTLSSSKSCNAWTNPQNLATWIDNEVNSLVHDLELNESKQKLSAADKGHHHSSQKHSSSRNNNDKANQNGTTSSSCKNKEGKRKWLSVTCGTIRRHSSGAHST